MPSTVQQNEGFIVILPYTFFYVLPGSVPSVTSLWKIRVIGININIHPHNILKFINSIQRHFNGIFNWMKHCPKLGRRKNS